MKFRIITVISLFAQECARIRFCLVLELGTPSRLQRIELSEGLSPRLAGALPADLVRIHSPRLNRVHRFELDSRLTRALNLSRPWIKIRRRPLKVQRAAVSCNKPSPQLRLAHLLHLSRLTANRKCILPTRRFRRRSASLRPSVPAFIRSLRTNSANASRTHSD